MSLNRSITIHTKEGYEYILGFSSFDAILIPESITKKIIEIVIAVKDHNRINNAKTLFAFAKNIKSYLNENDVILYCYCDNKDIERGEKHQHLTPQEFRSLLFKKMFERDLSNNFINIPIELTDLNDDKHYIHLFSSVENIEVLQVVSSEINKLNK